MKNIIKNLIKIAMETEDFETQDKIFEQIKNLIWKFADTINCPSNWRYIAEELAEEYKTNDISIYDTLELWNYDFE